MLQITKSIIIQDSEISMTGMHSGGPGGQHANKVASAIQLQFDISESTLPEATKHALLQLKDKRISKEGVITISARRYRSQQKNREDAMERLKGIILKSMKPLKKRKKTKTPKAVREKRLKQKKQRSELKKLRKKPI